MVPALNGPPGLALCGSSGSMAGDVAVKGFRV